MVIWSLSTPCTALCVSIISVFVRMVDILFSSFLVWFRRWFGGYRRVNCVFVGHGQRYRFPVFYYCKCVSTTHSHCRCRQFSIFLSVPIQGRLRRQSITRPSSASRFRWFFTLFTFYLRWPVFSFILSFCCFFWTQLFSGVASCVPIDLVWFLFPYLRHIRCLIRSRFYCRCLTVLPYKRNLEFMGRVYGIWLLIGIDGAWRFSTEPWRKYGTIKMKYDLLDFRQSMKNLYQFYLVSK